MRREKFKNVVKRLKGTNDEVIDQMFPETESDISYELVLKDFFKDELIEIAENWELKGVKSLNKSKAIEKIKENMRDNIKELLFKLDGETIEILKKLIKCGGILEAENLYTDIIDYFTSKGIAFPIRKDGKYYIYMPKEIAEMITIDSSKEFKNAVKENDTVLNLIKGIMINYGAVERENFFEMMNKYVETTMVVKSDWVECAKEYLIYDSLFHSYENGFAIVADEESADIIMREQKVRNSYDKHIFTAEELIESGKTGNPILTEFQIEFINDMIEVSDKKSEVIYEIFYEAVNSINYGRKYSEVMEDIMNIFNIDIDYKIKDKDFPMYFTEFCNNTRQWILNGNSPNEMIEKNSKAIKAETESHFNSEKIGRNEPCTCGSGKKYKKCCGK